MTKHDSLHRRPSMCILSTLQQSALSNQIQPQLISTHLISTHLMSNHCMSSCNSSVTSPPILAPIWLPFSRPLCHMRLVQPTKRYHRQYLAIIRFLCVPLVAPRPTLPIINMPWACCTHFSYFIARCFFALFSSFVPMTSVNPNMSQFAVASPLRRNLCFNTCKWFRQSGPQCPIISLIYTPCLFNSCKRFNLDSQSLSIPSSRNMKNDASRTFYFLSIGSSPLITSGISRHSPVYVHRLRQQKRISNLSQANPR